MPIHKDLLHSILRQVDIKYLEKSNQPYLALLFKTVFVTGYYGLLRIEEVVKGDHPVLAKDVQIGVNKRTVMFILRTSKTHWHDSEPQIVKIKSREVVKN